MNNKPAAIEVESITMQRAKFNRQKRKFDWLEHHHSKCTVKRGKCKWDQCPRWKRDDLKCDDKTAWKPYVTHYECVECSMKFGTDRYFCNEFSLNSYCAFWYF